tara:strand:+ start:47 stop:277 length:231 start_codon:yes stop_codon:yes gene_type:complete
MNTFNESQIQSMNYGALWNGCITIHKEKKSLFSNKPVSSEFELHATGDADLNGRKYVALPKGTELTDKVRKQYNIM